MLTGNGIFARFTAMSAHLTILIMIFKEYVSVVMVGLWLEDLFL
jgi:hypothetical protein